MTRFLAKLQRFLKELKAFALEIAGKWSRNEDEKEAETTV